MADNRDQDQSDSKSNDGGGRGRSPRRRNSKRNGGKKRDCDDCKFVDFKNVDLLKKNCTQQWKIQSRKRNNTTSKCQSHFKLAVKRARFMALVPYVG